jgi:hypothetical protein
VAQSLEALVAMAVLAAQAEKVRMATIQPTAVLAALAAPAE